MSGQVQHRRGREGCSGEWLYFLPHSGEPWFYDDALGNCFLLE